ncbi:MAG: MmcQ/YjbR family DNA-binding protein [Terracidiphilus sp.]
MPIADPERLAVMRERHSGKVRGWFNNSTHWDMVELDHTDLEKLVFLESDWTKNNGLVVRVGPDYRILKRVAQRAKAMNYFSLACCHVKQRAYYESLERFELTLQGASRLAICSAEPSEVGSNPSARYYLLDGVGRCLPYMVLLLEQKIDPLRIETFVAERGT